MKKFFIILLLWLITSSCNKYITTNVYEQKYTDVNVAYSDVYGQLYKYDLDSISINDWVTNNMITDTISIEQKTILKAVSDKSIYSFVFSKYVYPTSLYYNFLIRFSGKKKDLKQ